MLGHFLTFTSYGWKFQMVGRYSPFEFCIQSFFKKYLNLKWNWVITKIFKYVSHCMYLCLGNTQFWSPKFHAHCAWLEWKILPVSSCWILVKSNKGRRNRGAHAPSPQIFDRSVDPISNRVGQVMPTKLLLAPPPSPDFRSFLRPCWFYSWLVPGSMVRTTLMELQVLSPSLTNKVLKFVFLLLILLGSPNIPL